MLGELSPGDRLTTEDIADQLQISATPVREALARLEEAGLVVRVPYKGTFVSEITPDDVREIFALRGALEGWAVELATPRLSAETLAELSSEFESLSESLHQGKYSEYFEPDTRFHLTIVQSAANKWLSRVFASLSDQVHHIRAISTALPGEQILAAFDEHRAIFDALQRRDAAQARACMEYHLAHAGDRISVLLEDMKNPRGHAGTASATAEGAASDRIRSDTEDDRTQNQK